jgi:3-hydroxyacyl-[acyl-carrier-protein] dehydratase
MSTTLDIMAIMRRLPHRYPFLLIDRIISLVPGESITALKNVTMNEPFFQGHFPSQPVMPGVLIVEAMAQAGGVLASESRAAEQPAAIIYFMGMDQVRFRRPVVPGDQLVLEARVLKMRSKVAKMAGRALVGDTLVAEAELMASFGEAAAPA